MMTNENILVIKRRHPTILIEIQVRDVVFRMDFNNEIRRKIFPGL